MRWEKIDFVYSLFSLFSADLICEWIVWMFKCTKKKKQFEIRCINTICVVLEGDQKAVHARICVLKRKFIRKGFEISSHTIWKWIRVVAWNCQQKWPTDYDLHLILSSLNLISRTQIRDFIKMSIKMSNYA